MPVTNITAIAPIPRPEAPGATKQAEGQDFGELLRHSIESVERFRLNAESATNRFLMGETQEIHQMVLESQRAEIAFETFLQVRNKVVQAYQEVMRMQM